MKALVCAQIHWLLTLPWLPHLLTVPVLSGYICDSGYEDNECYWFLWLGICARMVSLCGHFLFCWNCQQLCIVSCLVISIKFCALLAKCQKMSVEYRVS